MNFSQKISLEDEAWSHLNLAGEWDGLLKTIREIADFETFLLPSPFPTIAEHLPPSGALVVINVHARRCDAIALLSGLDEPLHIPVPLFSLAKATEYRHALNVQLHSGGMRQQGDHVEGREDAETSERALEPPTFACQRPRSHAVAGVKKVLEGLWQEVVKPILDMLGIQKPDPESSARLPRIWWCPTGPLSFLPLHAAGVYGGLESESIMDYAVSSYTPTVAALTQRVDDDRPINEGVSGLFLTSQPSAPGTASITGTVQEVKSIYDDATKHGVRSLQLSGDEITTEDCLKYMEQFSGIHLACHASQNAAEPLRSRFRFHKGDLDLNTIMQRNLNNADLAFLSACETSTGEETLSDEAVHLAAGMLAAGYRRVVATMWRIDDTYATKVASGFYQYLWEHKREDSGARFDGAMSAYALHYATRQLRQQLGNSEPSLLAWMPFIHFGY